MLARSLTAVLVALTTVSAWPIYFYPTQDCRSEPIAILDEPLIAGKCGFFDGPVKSYSGGTADAIQKVLIYYKADLCPADAAHRLYSNHTINNSRNECIPFKKKEQTPEAFTFIEEFLPPKNSSTSNAACNAIRVQT